MRRHFGRRSAKLRWTGNERIFRYEKHLLNIIETDHVQFEASALATWRWPQWKASQIAKEKKTFLFNRYDQNEKTISVSAGTDDAPLYRHAQPDASHLSRICAESYRVVGALAEGAQNFNDVGVIKALDNLSSQELIHDDVLPFSVPGSCAASAGSALMMCWTHCRRLLRIRLDMNDFDGDRRGIADCLA